MRKALPSNHYVMLILFAFILVTSFTSCKKETKEPPRTYKFSERPKLEWSDFKGLYTLWEEFDAALSSGISYEYKPRIENGKLVIEFNVYCFFSQENSWTKHKEDAPLLLEHEQLHYYISEVQARILRKDLQEFQFTKNYEEEIFEHYCYNKAFRTVMQDDYDNESDHSVIREEQLKWERKIAQQMVDLAGYSNENFTCKTNVPITQAELDANM